MKDVIQVDRKHPGQHPIVLLTLDKPAYIDKKASLYGMMEINDYYDAHNIPKQTFYLGRKVGGWVIDKKSAD